jgi:hypothetical protein
MTKELKITDKAKYLKDNYPFENVPELTDQLECIHCNSVITVGDYKVFKAESGFEYICCPNAPECDGTVIDWISAENCFSDDEEVDISML